MLLPASDRPQIRILRTTFGLLAALVVAMLLNLSGSLADAQSSFVVNTTADDATGTASNCTSSPEGVCTLRDALAAANAVAASNITFDPTVFLESNSAAANTITLSNGTLNIPSGATITGLTSGSGATLTNLVTVDGNHATGVFSVASGVTGAVIANLNIMDGDSGWGGGISNSGELTVTGSTFSGNSAEWGGAIYDGPCVECSSSNPIGLTVTDSTFSGNSGGFGGAIFEGPCPFCSLGNPIELTVIDSAFSGNSANFGGGAIDGESGSLTVEVSTFNSNSAAEYAGAIFFENNTSSNVTVTGSTFSGNSAAYAGAIWCLASYFIVTNSTFSGNSAPGGGAIVGDTSSGPIELMTVTGSTFADNFVGSGGAIIFGQASGVVNNSTISGNFGLTLTGSGIDAYDSTLNIANSIVAGNTAGGSYPDIYLDSYSTLTNLGGNVINTSASPTVVDPHLSLLGNYGGPTQTMLPEPGSGAICGGLASNIPAGVTTDQRGYPIENTTYPGYSSSTPCVDSGAVQTNYAIAFTTQPPASATVNEAIAPAPVVTLTESGNPASGVNAGMVRMTDSASALSGAISENLLTGTATFPGLELTSEANDDIFTAWLGLNPMLNISARASVGVTAVAATGPLAAVMLLPAPGITTIVGTSNILFQWSGGADVTSYELLIGTSGVGSSNILATAPLTTKSYTVPALPHDGVTLYVRLGSLINGAWQTADYQYTESPTGVPAIMQSPKPGASTILGISNILFQWSKGVSVTSYELLIGTNGVGSSNILATAPLTTNWYTVPALPNNSATLFVRLGSLIYDAWQTEDYVYTESGPATLTPSSGTLSTSQLFTWSNGNEGATQYRLVVSSEGPGSPILFDTGSTTERSATVSIPANGATIVATLYQLVNDVWQHSEYTFTAPGTQTPATLTPGSGTLTTSQTFDWSNGNEARLYQLVVQSDGPGSPVLYYSGDTQETSATVNIPANGATVTAWLYQLVNDVWQRTIYTFTAPGTRTAAMLTPASGTLSTSQLFDWGNGNEAIYYHLQLGTKGPGSTDLLGTGLTTATSVTVSIPANGKKVFAVLYQLVDDVWQHTDYTFTEP